LIPLCAANVELTGRAPTGCEIQQHAFPAGLL
jgi:hypothetical protein